VKEKRKKKDSLPCHKQNDERGKKGYRVREETDEEIKCNIAAMCAIYQMIQ